MSEAIDHHARLKSQEARMLAQSAIEKTDGLDARFKEDSRTIWEALNAQRAETQSNHATTINSISGVRKAIDSSHKDLATSLVDSNTKFYAEITLLKQQDLALANSSSKKEVNFYRGIAAGLISIVLLLVGYVWLSQGGG